MNRKCSYFWDTEEEKQKSYLSIDKNMIGRKMYYFEAWMVSHSVSIEERNKEKRIRKLCYEWQLGNLPGSKCWEDLSASEDVGSSVAGRVMCPWTGSVAMALGTQTRRTSGLMSTSQGPWGTVCSLYPHIPSLQKALWVTHSWKLIAIPVLGTVVWWHVLLLHVFLCPRYHILSLRLYSLQCLWYI